MFFGAFWYKNGSLHVLSDLTKREKAMLIPLVMLTILLGILPNILFNITGPTVEAWLGGLK
jgi:NADH-quinone oxidoreductase subunit M